MKGGLFLGAALLALALQGCGIAVIGATGTAAAAIMDRRTSSAIYQDESLALHIRERISERFGSLTHVNVAPYNRVILLTGEAPDEPTRQAVEAIVRDIANVRGIVNEIRVAPASSLAERANDSLITTRVKARFADADRFHPVHVKVVTEAGVVYLLGVVTEREASDAVEIARTTGGVVKVVKMFTYCQPTDELCTPYKGTGTQGAPAKTQGTPPQTSQPPA